jgi:hypothetical protein
MSRACRICGAPIPEGEGRTDPEPDFLSSMEHSSRKHWLTTLPDGADGWRHTCQTCANAESERRAEAAAILAVCGIDVPASDARLILSEFSEWDGQSMTFRSSFPTAENVGRVGRKPWSHVTDAERDHVERTVLRALSELDARRSPSPSSWGGCGMCGVAQALGDWWEAPDYLRWPDGSRAAFCASCGVVWQRRGTPTAVEDVRKVAVEAATGWAVPLGVVIPESFRLFAESRAADPAGLPEPWSWSPELVAYVESVWESRPEFAPEDRREEFQRREHERRRERANFFAQEREAERARGW